jgi:maltose-binding protein MalE
MRKRSLLLLFIILGLSIILLSQCTKSVKNNQTASSDKVTVTVGDGKDKTPKGDTQMLKVTVSMKSAEFAVLQKQSAQYTAAHQGINVELNNLPETDAYSTLKKENQLGDGPDLMLLNNSWVNEFAALGFLHPMDEFFTGEQQSHGITALMDQVKWNGYLWAIPKDVDPYILVWNKNLAADNKLDHSPNTIEEWLAWNKAMMHPEEGKYGIYIDASDPYAFLSLISTLGENGSDSTLPLFKLSDPAILKKIESFFVPQDTTWNVKAFQKNYPAVSSTWDPWQLLLQGKMAGMVTTISEFKRHVDSTLYLAALSLKKTAGSSENYGLLKGRSYSISSHSKNSTLAINWIKEMTSIGTDLMVWDEAKLLPSLPTAYLSEPISNDAYSNSYIWLINNGKVLPVETETNKRVNNLQLEIQKLWNGEETMKVFLENSAKLWIPEKSSF